LGGLADFADRGVIGMRCLGQHDALDMAGAEQCLLDPAAEDRMGCLVAHNGDMSAEIETLDEVALHAGEARRDDERFRRHPLLAEAVRIFICAIEKLGDLACFRHRIFYGCGKMLLRLEKSGGSADRIDRVLRRRSDQGAEIRLAPTRERPLA